jgi:hypothetical protein
MTDARKCSRKRFPVHPSPDTLASNPARYFIDRLLPVYDAQLDKATWGRRGVRNSAYALMRAVGNLCMDIGDDPGTTLATWRNCSQLRFSPSDSATPRAVYAETACSHVFLTGEHAVGLPCRPPFW